MVFKCNNCNSEFTRLYNLNIHQKNAKYCKKIQSIQCEYCNSIILKEKYNSHIAICIEYYKKKIEILETQIKELEIYKNNYMELKQENKELQNKLDDITNKLIVKPNIINNYRDNSKNTTNNTKIDIFNTLTPLTDNDFKDNVDKLTIEHIKRGAEGYASYSLEYPLKDKLMCIDYARKKICYKDENGNKVEEYKLNNILSKLFTFINKKNINLIKEYIEITRNESNEYSNSVNSEMNENSEEWEEFCFKSDYYQDLMFKYVEMISDSKKIVDGENNSLKNEITDILLTKLPK